MYVDDMLMRTQAGEDNATVIVGRRGSSKMLIAHAVPAKGESEDWAAKPTVNDIMNMVHNGPFVIRSGGEPTTACLLGAVAQI